MVQGMRRAWILVFVVLVAAPPAVADAARAKLRPAAPKVVGARVVEPGATISVIDHVRNKGRARSRATRTRFLLSLDIKPSRDDLRLGGRRIPPLRHVQASRKTVTLRIPAATNRGLWRLIACVRKRCRVSSLPLRVGAPVSAGGGPAPAPGPQETPTTDPASVRDCDVPIAADSSPASDFTQMFRSATKGWTGGDSAYSLRLPNGTTAWWFGDTYLGNLLGDGRRHHAWYETRNSVVVQSSDCLTTRFRGSLRFPRSFELAEGDPESAWYWPNAQIVHGDRVRAFWTRTVSGGTDGYIAGGSALATYDLDLNLQSVRTIPTDSERMWWGAAVLDDGAYTYVYGIRHTTTTNVVLARTPAGRLDGPWEYRTGSGWSSSLGDAVAVHQHTAAQINILRDRGDWVLVTQVPGTRTVNAWRAQNPWGPWPGGGNKFAELPDVPSAREYNIQVHPESTSGADWLISYNVMPDSEATLMADDSLYRPRFLRAALP